jgi:hypothetical protein
MWWPQVDLVSDVYSVRKVVTLRKLKDPKTENAARDVDITPGMKRWLVEQKSRSFLPYKYVWVTEKGRP